MSSNGFQKVEDIRQELIEEDVLAEVDGCLQFVKPYIFYSSFKNSTALSISASVIAHGNKNGWLYWKDKKRKPISENEVLQAKFGEHPDGDE